MHEATIGNAIFLIFVGAAALATLALFARQAMIVAYVIVGAILGPPGLNLVNDAAWLQGIADIGIVFLLYLLGINLAPHQLTQMFREALWVTLVSSLVFALAAAMIAFLFGWSRNEAMVAGAVFMFSSTIIGVKLLPTTTLHHLRMGQVMISVLLLQDLLAILFMLFLDGSGGERGALVGIGRQLLALVVVAAVAVGLQRTLLGRLIARFDRIHEYIFLLVIAWCLGIAELAAWLGLSHAIGAFVAGVALAESPVSQFIAESLKPLRDFFLVLFFFSLGATFDTRGILDSAIVALTLTLVCVLLKPAVFGALLRVAGEKPTISAEIGVRLGQISEFSLLVLLVALQKGVVGQAVADALKLATLLTFIISSYWIVMRFPTPMAITDRLRRD